MTEQTKQIIQSGVKVGAIVAKPPPVVVVRRMTPENIAIDIATRITGKLIKWGDLFDPKTGQFLTEAELVALGAVFMTIAIDKVLTKSDTTVKGRTNKMPTPYIKKTSKYQVIGNIDWTSYINRRSEHGEFVAAKERTNGIVNFENCRAVGITTKGNHTINGVAFRVLEPTKYFDGNENEYSDKKTLEAEYLKKPSKESKAKEAKKHGISVKLDPKYRTTRIDSCEYIRAFTMKYIPIIE